jgi:hypothetical protein
MDGSLRGRDEVRGDLDSRMFTRENSCREAYNLLILFDLVTFLLRKTSKLIPTSKRPLNSNLLCHDGGE